MEEYFSIQTRIAEAVDMTFIRSVYEKIQWNSRLIGILGARGTGKSTLVMQYFKNKFNDPEKCLYISADNPIVLGRGIYSIVSEFFKMYGNTVIVDEVHKQKNWSLEIKALYDSFPRKQIIVLGSSAAAILQEKGDLSRRMKLYHCPVLSFGEFLSIRHKTSIQNYSFEEIIQDHSKICRNVLKRIPDILMEFREYLQFGSFPFFIENSRDEYLSLLENVLDKVIYEDIQTVKSLKNFSALKMKKLLGFLALSPIPLFNTETLKNKMEVSKDTLYDYFDLLERTNILQIIRSAGKPETGLKNAKVFFQSPNYYYCIAENFWKNSADTGNIRESFFVSQISQFLPIKSSDSADFTVYIKKKIYELEIGGRSKSKKQIEGLSNAYVFKDGIEVGAGNVIPLYLTGMLY
ncbi:MAG TPA: AAA family ATPase [Leptospiraceae bacterium]|nr:AAA family ATPase [Leptospiraceae bacterium]HNF27000.1 AAA family ATPase [Leptospiraceae bacterium]HNI95416.1 AAA family ATPase [Leptospiraceae bacterium]